MRFRDRVDAGQRLAQVLIPWRDESPVVLGLPRGGVPVAAEVARGLDAPLDVLVVRKLGLPVQPELAMGAIGEGGVRVINETVVYRAGVSDAELARVEGIEQVELDRQASRFRGDRPPVPLAGRTALIVDDGIATGSTALVAVQVARAFGAARVVVAAPVAAPSSVRDIRSIADDVVCLETPIAFAAVGQWYDDFRPTTDDDVIRCLRSARVDGPSTAQ